MKICSDNDCTGCFACLNICPVNAIQVMENNLGHYVPKISFTNCIKCDLCKKICPANHSSNYCYPKDCYALWTKNIMDSISSSSGGVATTFGRKIVKNGGVVFGTKYVNGELIFSKTYSELGLEEFKGSKYVQAYVGTIYSETLSELKTGKKVLFIGTPCQVDGLKHYLGKDYENLITVDLICHGVPPMKYLREYVSKVANNKTNTKVLFRGLHDFKLMIYSQNEVCYKKDVYEDMYYCAFEKGLIQRGNCYLCRYARPERISDITIGDFWGLDNVYCMNATFLSGSYIKPSKSICNRFNKQFIF